MTISNGYNVDYVIVRVLLAFQESLVKLDKKARKVTEDLTDPGECKEQEVIQ